MRRALTISSNYRGARWRSVRLCHDLHLSPPVETKEEKRKRSAIKEERRKVICGCGGVDVALIRTDGGAMRKRREKQREGLGVTSAKAGSREKLTSGWEGFWDGRSPTFTIPESRGQKTRQEVLQVKESRLSILIF